MGKQGMLDVKLILVGGATKSTEIDLELPTVIGRGREACLMLPDALVSRRHCELLERDGRLFVRDLGSMNGTFIGAQRVTESVLPRGELLTIGSLTFRAVYGGEASSTDSARTSPGDLQETSKELVKVDGTAHTDDLEESPAPAEDSVDETGEFAGWTNSGIDVDIPDRQTMLRDDSADDSSDSSSLQFFIRGLE